MKLIFNAPSNLNDSMAFSLCNSCFAECIVPGVVPLLVVSPPQGAQNSQLSIRHDLDMQ